MANPQNVVGKGNRWKKGESGNPKGRPKKLPDLNILLAEVLGEQTKNGKTAAQQILAALRTRAKRGDVRAAEVLLERAYGKVKQDMNLTTRAFIKTLNIDPLADDTTDNGDSENR